MESSEFNKLMGVDLESINFSLSLPDNRDAFIKEMDKGGTFLIKFKKVTDGSIRYLTCTRDWDKLSKSDRGYIPPKGLRPENRNIITVWDLMTNEFRSFKPDSVIQFNRISSKLVNQYNIYIKMDIDEFNDLLNNNILRLKYTKSDGSTRAMVCTRDMKEFKDESHDDIITVFDLDKKDYRNIRFNNVMDLKIENPYSNRIKKLLNK